MPEEEMWATFFDVNRILTQLQCEDPAADIVEFGCGYGTFTVAAAARTRGTVFALDLEPEMIATETRTRYLLHRHGNRVERVSRWVSSR